MKVEDGETKREKDSLVANNASRNEETYLIILLRCTVLSVLQDGKQKFMGYFVFTVPSEKPAASRQHLE